MALTKNLRQGLVGDYAVAKQNCEGLPRNVLLLRISEVWADAKARPDRVALGRRARQRSREGPPLQDIQRLIMATVTLSDSPCQLAEHKAAGSGHEKDDGYSFGAWSVIHARVDGRYADHDIIVPQSERSNSGAEKSWNEAQS